MNSLSNQYKPGLAKYTSKLRRIGKKSWVTAFKQTIEENEK